MADSFWEERYEQETVQQEAESKEYLMLKRLMSYWYIPVAIIIGMIISKAVALLMVMALMIGSAVLVSAYRLVVPFNVGLELVTFWSILLSAAVNPFAGAVVAVAAIMISHTIYNNHCAFMFIKMGVYAGLCFLVVFFEPAGIVTAGIILVLLRNAIFLLMTFFLNPKRLVPDLPAAAINIALNLWLFAKLGEWMVGVLQ